MAAFGYSRQELFGALPEIVRLFGPEKAEEVLARIRAEAAGKPLAELEVLTGEANFREQRGDLTAAIALSEQAIAKAADAGAGPAMRRGLALNLLSCRLAASADGQTGQEIDQEIAELARGGRDSVLAAALLLRASARLRDAGTGIGAHGEPDSRSSAQALAAERDIEFARTCEVAPAQGSSITLARVMLCRALGRDEEGLRLSGEAVRRLRQRLPAAGLPSRQWTDLLEHLRILYSYRAEVLAGQRPPRLQEAFECADEGRAQLLRHELAHASVDQDGGGLGDVTSYARLRELLREQEAALVLFDVGARSASAWIVDPAQPRPSHCPMSVTREELARMARRDPSRTAAKATAAVFAALSELSRTLLPPLEPVAVRYPLLYVVPASELYGVPFAALRFADGGYLVERCAIAYTPSASVLRWCVERPRVTAGGRSFLAVGAGGVGREGTAGYISFASQAREITQWVAGIDGMAARLLPETTTGSEFLEQAGAADIVHLECHGSWEPTVTSADPLDASFLELADRLPAREVAGSPGRLRADLVFMNACLSAAFTPGLRDEAGGFWQAFLIGGTSSLVATLTKVDPRTASELVAGFYEHWLRGGLSKGQALAATQRAMLSAGRPPEDWAAHILIGDAR
jgi:CHAT domain-containing protein